jgi:hypothetical protein
LPVLPLRGLGVAGQEDAGLAVAQEDGNRVVVGLGEDLAGWRGDDVFLDPSVPKLIYNLPRDWWDHAARRHVRLAGPIYKDPCDAP